jgi:hypothetical protein
MQQLRTDGSDSSYVTVPCGKAIPPAVEATWRQDWGPICLDYPRKMGVTGGNWRTTAFGPIRDCTSASRLSDISFETTELDITSDFVLGFGQGTIGHMKLKILNSVTKAETYCNLNGSMEVGQILDNIRTDGTFPGPFLHAAKRGGLVWYECDVPKDWGNSSPNNYRLSPKWTQVSFDIDTTTLSIDQSWACSASDNTTDDP